MFTKNRKKLIKSLHQKKYRDLHGLFLVEGEKMVNELLESNFEVEDILVSKEYSSFHEQVEVIDSKDLESLSMFKNASGVVAVAQQKKFDLKPKNLSNRIIVLDNLRDPGNLGTIIRTADWFGIKDVILSNESVETWNPKVVQSTMGSIFRTNVYRAELKSSLEQLKEEGYKISSAEMNGENANEVSWAEKSILVIGSESHGVSEVVNELADNVITIPKAGKAESLNAAVAASIIMNNWSKT